MHLDLERAHKHSIFHRESVLRSDQCGCFYCMAIFPPDRISEWVDDGQTALCPECGIDSVIGSASGIPIENQFLREMQSYWFSESLFKLGEKKSP